MHVQEDIAAENNFTGSLEIEPRRGGYLNVSVYTVASWVATVTLQRYFPDVGSWTDVKAYTTDTEEVLRNTEPGVLHRIGVKTGDYTSGTVGVRLGT